MTQKLYNKKKRKEMLFANTQHIHTILLQNPSITTATTTSSNEDRITTNNASSSTTSTRATLTTSTTSFRMKRYESKRIDQQLQYALQIITNKEKDIRLWLTMTTRNPNKIIQLTHKLHSRWTEVKNIQHDVKPKRRKLKTLRFAMFCEQNRVIEEEQEEVEQEEEEDSEFEEESF